MGLQLLSSLGNDSGTVVRDSAGRVASFGTFAVLARDGQGRVTSYRDGAATYAISYGAQGVTEVRAA